MASTFTTNFGFEEIANGEQSETWGTTTNYNYDILDRIAAYTTVALSGTTHTLTVREASPGQGTENLQDGMYRVVKFTGALGANNTVTIAPNTSKAYFIFENATTDSGSSGPYSVVLSQGSGANVTLQNGKNAIVYCDGAGSGAAIVNALSDLQIATLEVTGAAAIDGAAQFNSTVTVGVDDTGHDVKFFGATAGHYLHWDESADALILYGELQTATAGTSNLALGVDAGIAIASGGNYNVLIGDNAGEAITTGDENVAVGYKALQTNTEANYNTAVGHDALQDATDGHSCTAVGRQALANVTTGVYNIAIGRDSADALTTGDRNVAVGCFALDAETTGDRATSVGYAALGAQANSSNVDTYNTGLGYEAAPDITTGRFNTCVGSSSAGVLTTGSDNVYVGYNTDASAVDVSDEIVIGRDVTGGGTATARFGLGSNSATLGIDGSDTSWAAASDERLKTEIKSSNAGLDFINDLRPVTYRWKAQKDVPSEMSQYAPDSDEPCKGNGKTNHGFVAQEVKRVIDSHNLADGNNIWSEDPDGTQQIAPGNFMPMAIRAIQELSEKVTMLEAKIKQYENK